MFTLASDIMVIVFTLGPHKTSVLNTNGYGLLQNIVQTSKNNVFCHLVTRIHAIN